MQYRKLSATGDYVFGRGKADFLINLPETVGQAVITRLRLWQGEWFVDTIDGTPWGTQVLGKYTAATRDVAIRVRVLGTPGVNAILSYNTNVDDQTRRFSAQIVIDTIYGQVVVVGVATVPTARDRLDIDFFLDRSFLL